jgi:DNA mismatch repair protein MLH1
VEWFFPALVCGSLSDQSRVIITCTNPSLFSRLIKCLKYQSLGWTSREQTNFIWRERSSRRNLSHAVCRQQEPPLLRVNSERSEMTIDAEDASPHLPKPRPIRRLPEEVVNRIAAGEVVVSPAAALKELLENSLDAGAKSITVSARGGGAKLLRVCDDGKGIAKDDLPLLCQRFATSKLRTFEDLRGVLTFGFRGEALASVSHVSHVSVLTKIEGDACAHSAKYLDGELVAPPTQKAGLDGTTLTVEDLFYNLPTRRRGLRPAGEEYRAIVDVMTRYSIKYSHVSFICRRLADGSAGGRGALNGPDVRTAAGSSPRANIQAAFGAFVAQELLEFQLEMGEFGMKVCGIATNPGFSMKKGIFILFINGRLVECSPLKRAVESVYTPFLPKGGHSFVYLDVTMRQTDIDVNVHPSKKEVRFLWETNLIEAITNTLDINLKSDGKSRTFLAQALISQGETLPRPSHGFDAGIKCRHLKHDREHAEGPEAELMATFQGQDEKHENRKRLKVLNVQKRVTAPSLIDFEAQADDNGDDGEDDLSSGDESFMDDGSQSKSGIEKGVRPPDSNLRPYGSDESQVVTISTSRESRQGEGQDLIQLQAVARKSLTLASKDKVRTSRTAPVGAMDAFMSRNGCPSPAVGLRQRRQRRSGAIPMLTSIQETIADLARGAHTEAGNILRNHTFVGVVNEKYVLIQHLSNLLLVEAGPVITELMYRQLLMRVADLDVLKIDPPAPILPLVALATNESARSSADERGSDGPARACVELLLDKADMLEEYFSIKISGAAVEDAFLDHVPQLFAGMAPDLARAPEFFLALLEIDWLSEQPCLTSVSQKLAEWYGEGWTTEYRGRDDYVTNFSASEVSTAAPNSDPQENEWYLKHVLFESMRHDFDPSETVACAIREVTSTQKLYKIFERC